MNRIISTIVIALVVMACTNMAQENKDEAATPVEVVTPEPQEEEATGNAAEAEYIIISKQTMTLRLYDTSDDLICRFPIASGKYAGNKQKPGDMKTPEGEFTITEIAPAAHWTHDFGDGKGAVKGCYGNWFVRLHTPQHKGIGIHGTSDPNTIGTRATDGCIILNNNDLDSLKPMLKLGMRVAIEPGDIDLKADGIAVTVDQEPEQPKPVVTQPEAIDEPVVEVKESVKEEQKENKVIEQPAVEQSAATDELWHVVVDGDLVGRIAAHYGTTSKKIAELNPGINIDRISIGQRIKVRGKAESKAPESKPADSATDSGEEVWYTVVDGDLVGRIAQRYGTTSKKIAELNPDMNIDRISIGQRIRVK